MPTVERNESMDTPRALRQLKAGVSLGDVARGTDISVSHVSRIFNGRRRPSTRTAMTLANFLGVTVDDLLAALDEAGATTPRTRLIAA